MQLSLPHRQERRVARYALAIALRWTEALREAYLGRDVGEALRAAATGAQHRFAATR